MTCRIIVQAALPDVRSELERFSSLCDGGGAELLRSSSGEECPTVAVRGA